MQHPFIARYFRVSWILFITSAPVLTGTFGFKSELRVVHFRYQLLRSRVGINAAFRMILKQGKIVPMFQIILKRNFVINLNIERRQILCKKYDTGPFSCSYIHWRCTTNLPCQSASLPIHQKFDLLIFQSKLISSHLYQR